MQSKPHIDEDEDLLTIYCHWPSIELLYELLDKLPAAKYDRALEFGCGDARYTIDALLKKYHTVDLFYKNKSAIKTSRELKDKHSAIGEV